MQRRDNPYTPGAGRKPPYLAGRDRDLEEFSALIELLSAGGAERSFIYSGRGVADSGAPEQDLVDLLREIGHTAQAARSGALFLLDEMNNLDASSLAAVCMAFQAVSRDPLPVALVGAGLPDLQGRLMRAKPYADWLFQYRELGRLRDAEAHGALVKPASNLGVELEQKAAMQVVHLAAGYPYFLQEYGRELWNAAESSPIRTADVVEVRPRKRSTGTQLLRDALRSCHRLRAALPGGDGLARPTAVSERGRRSCLGGAGPAPNRERPAVEVSGRSRHRSPVERQRDVDRRP